MSQKRDSNDIYDPPLVTNGVKYKDTYVPIKDIKRVVEECNMDYCYTTKKLSIEEVEKIIIYLKYMIKVENHFQMDIRRRVDMLKKISDVSRKYVNSVGFGFKEDGLPKDLNKVIDIVYSRVYDVGFNADMDKVMSSEYMDKEIERKRRKVCKYENDLDFYKWFYDNYDDYKGDCGIACDKYWE